MENATRNAKNVALVVASIAFGALATWSAGISAGAAALAFLTLLTNALMAAAAVGAFFFWRKQTVAQTRASKEHEIASQVMTCAFVLENSIKETLYTAETYSFMMSHCDLALDSELWRTWRRAVRKHVKEIRKSLIQWSGCKPLLQATWDREAAARLESLRLLADDWCEILSVAARRRDASWDGPREEPERAWRWPDIFAGDQRSVDAFVGALDHEVNMLDEWTSEWLGKSVPRERAGARTSTRARAVGGMAPTAMPVDARPEPPSHSTYD